MSQPTFGHTRTGKPVHAHTFHYYGGLSLRGLREAVSASEGFNAKLAVIITSAVGTMACAYIFAALALVSAPDKFKEGKKGAIEWIAQTFLQLVLLSVIMVGQRVAGKAADARSSKQFEDTEQILDRLDLNTAGGLRDVRNDLAYRLEEIEKLIKQQPPPPAPFEPRVPETPPPANRPVRPVRPSKK